MTGHEKPLAIVKLAAFNAAELKILWEAAGRLDALRLHARDTIPAYTPPPLDRGGEGGTGGCPSSVPPQTVPSVVTTQPNIAVKQNLKGDGSPITQQDIFALQRRCLAAKLVTAAEVKELYIGHGATITAPLPESSLGVIYRFFEEKLAKAT